MAYNKKAVTKLIKLTEYADYNKMSNAQKAEAKTKVGEFVVEQTQKFLNRGETPVSGGKFRQPKKQDGKLSKLFLSGDMRASITHEERAGGVEVGIRESDQAIKAYGHNTGFKGHPEERKMKKYERDFIPKPEQKYKRDITSGIRKILKSIVSDS